MGNKGRSDEFLKVNDEIRQRVWIESVKEGSVVELKDTTPHKRKNEYNFSRGDVRRECGYGGFPVSNDRIRIKRL